MKQRTLFRTQRRITAERAHSARLGAREAGPLHPCAAGTQGVRFPQHTFVTPRRPATRRPMGSPRFATTGSNGRRNVRVSSIGRASV